MKAKNLLESYIKSIIEEILVESKQNLMNLGYPEVIASLIFSKFGKHDFIIAKWLREYDGRRAQEDETYSKDWWHNSNDYGRRGEMSLSGMVKTYEAAKSGDAEKYKKTLMNELPDYYDEDYNEDLYEAEKDWKVSIEDSFFKNIFFRQPLIKAVENKKINPNEYKKLSYRQAVEKYDEKRLFADQEPLKTYKDGYKWINVGPRCELVGRKMKNCGSAGVMSMDPDKTIITLFDKEDNPHVVVTYSPNDKRISGDEGRGSTAVKEKYHDYVLDLAKLLDARFDIDRTKSPSLKMKAVLGAKLKNVEQIPYEQYDPGPFYQIELASGEMYYGTGSEFVKKEDADKLFNNTENKNKQLNKMFNRMNNDIQRYGLKNLV